MDLDEKRITLNYLESLMEIKKSGLGNLIDTLNQIYAGQSGVSLVTCVSELYSKVSEIGEISNQIEDLKEELGNIKTEETEEVANDGPGKRIAARLSNVNDASQS